MTFWDAEPYTMQMHSRAQLNTPQLGLHLEHVSCITLLRNLEVALLSPKLPLLCSAMPRTMRRRERMHGWDGIVRSWWADSNIT